MFTNLSQNVLKKNLMEVSGFTIQDVTICGHVTDWQIFLNCGFGLA